jgi:hypothetical protein
MMYSVQHASDFEDQSRTQSVCNSSWDAAVFQGMSLQGMQMLNEHFRSRLSLRDQLHSSIADTASLKEDGISSASTATSEDEKDMATTGSMSCSYTCDEEDLETLHLRKQSNGIDVSSRSNLSEDIRVEDVASPPTVFSWIVDAKKLRTRDQQIISPTFKIGTQTSCRLMIKPTSMGDRKRQTTFLKSSGCGSIEFKLVESAGAAPALGISISIGKGERTQASPGSVKHDFARSSVCQLGDEWNFRSAVDVESTTFLVSVEVFW